MNPAAKRVCFFALALFVVFLRVVHLDSDPPKWLSWSSGIYSDEGIYANDARSEALFGHWAPGDFHSAEIAPIQHLLLLGTFNILGVSLVSARLISVVSSLLICLFFFLALRRLYDEKTAYIGVTLLGVSPVFLFYSRLALLEMPTVLFLTIALYLYSSKQSGWPTGLLLALAIICKPLALLCCPAFFLDYRASSRLALERLAALAAGLVIYFIMWQMPHHADLARLNHYYIIHQYLPHSMSQLRHNIVRSVWSGWSDGIFPYLYHHELLLSAGAVVALFTATHARKPSTSIFAVWLLLPMLAFCLISYEPSRYFILFWPALVALAAEILGRQPIERRYAGLVIYVAVSLAVIAPTLVKPTYFVKNDGVAVSKSFKPATTVIGQYAPEFCLNNRLPSMYVQPGLANSTGSAGSDIVLITQSPYWTNYWAMRTHGNLAQLNSISLNLPHNQQVTAWKQR